MTKTIIGISIGVVILAGAVFAFRPGDTNSQVPVNDKLIVQETDKYDFGSISMAAGKVKHEFKIKNTGTEAINLQKLYTSCMCTTATLTLAGKQVGPFGMPGHGVVPSINESLPPQEEGIVEIVFDPAAHGPAGVGRISRTVSLENNAGRPVQFYFSAMVTP